MLLTLAGAASAFAVPLNALFGRAVPVVYRGRAFGVAITGLSGLQGTAMVLAGLAADRWPATTVIGFSGVSGGGGGPRSRSTVAACRRIGAVRAHRRTRPNDSERRKPYRRGGRSSTLRSSGEYGVALRGEEKRMRSVRKRGISWT
ncbi:hypothetical protein [Micromonospora sp. NPDC049102]|uniref:hypothetical protein n=1 Tax=Micromonospora sp. NPDC049102 TaxID=3364265 RepID=UPI003717137D